MPYESMTHITAQLTRSGFMVVCDVLLKTKIGHQCQRRRLVQFVGNMKPHAFDDMSTPNGSKCTNSSGKFTALTSNLSPKDNIVPPRGTRETHGLTKDFSKDENQNHADKDSRLLHVSTDSLVTDDTDAVSGSETGHTDGQSTGEVHETTGDPNK
ncbi:hypothetical protein E4U53_002311 [Claviceps sorghi]|nr:hypothetical protein E4U53_002311 [Claviceps sorghi]